MQEVQEEVQEVQVQVWCGHRCPRSADTAASLTPYKVIDTRPRNVSRPAGGSWRHGHCAVCTGGH